MNSARMVVGLLLGAAPLIAQQPVRPDSMRPGMMGPGMQGMMQGHEMPGMMGMHGMMEMMGPMLRGMAFAPAHLLERKDALGLTQQQIARLTALRDAAKVAHDAAAAEAKRHHDALAEVLKGSAPDTAAARQHFQAAHQAMGNAHWAMLRAAVQARAVLTEVQRARVEGWVDAMQMQMHQRMRGGERGQPPHERP